MTHQLDCPACCQKLYFPSSIDSYETSSLAKQLPDDITTKILSQFEELKAIEVQKETISLLSSLKRLLYLE